MTFNGRMEPGPWYSDGVEIGVEDVPEEDILYTVKLRANNRAIRRDDVYNIPVPSEALAGWLRARNRADERIRMGNFELVDRHSDEPYFTVSFFFKEKDLAILFKLVWA